MYLIIDFKHFAGFFEVLSPLINSIVVNQLQRVWQAMFRINYGKRCILCKLPYKLCCKTFVKQVTEVTIKLLVMPPKRKRKAEPVSINKDKPATKKRRKTRKKCH